MNKIKTKLMFLLVVIVLMPLFGCIYDIENNDDWDVTLYSNKLVSINLGNQSKGAFFLASGTIQDEVYYRFLRKISNGGVRFDECPAKKAIVYEESRIDAIVIKQQNCEGYWRWVFYVPTGTIYYNLSINLDDLN